MSKDAGFALGFGALALLALGALIVVMVAAGPIRAAADRFLSEPDPVGQEQSQTARVFCAGLIADCDIGQSQTETREQAEQAQDAGGFTLTDLGMFAVFGLVICICAGFLAFWTYVLFPGVREAV